MGTIALTIPVAGSTLFSTAAANVDTDLGIIQTWANGNVDGANVVASLTGRRLIGQACGQFAGGTALNYFLDADGTILNSGGSTSGSSIPPVFFYLDPANYAVVGKANTQLIVRISAYTNATAPTISFNGQLRAATFAGGANVIQPTAGAQQGTSATITTPGASSVNVAECTPFTFPTAGAYAPIVNLSGSQAASSVVMVVWQLFVQNT